MLQELKEMLYDGIANAPKIQEGGFNDGRLNFGDYVSRFDDSFFKRIDMDLEKINKFHKGLKLLNSN